MGKKSQTTIYVIIGLIIVIVLSIYFGSTLFKQKGSIVTPQTSSAKFTQDTINLLVDDCLRTIVIQSIDELGLCGTEESFKRKIIREFPSCFDFSRFTAQSYEVMVSNRPDEVEVDILPEKIRIYLKYPMEFSKDTTVLSFSDRTYNFPRTQTLKLDLDADLRTKNEQILISPDLDFELRIPRGTKVTSNEITVHIQELCPDDSSVLGKVTYSFTPEHIEFSPEAILAIRFESDQVSRLADPRDFKIAFLDNNVWKLIPSSSNPEKNKISATTSHLSDWSANCIGSVDHGIQVMFHDKILDTSSDLVPNIIYDDLQCAHNFSGSCSFVKLILYNEPDVENYLDIYTEVITAIYDMELIPVLNLREKPPSNDIWPHPGDCSSGLDCIYGENEDGSNKPVYSYSDAADNAMILLDAIHKDNPQWPLLIEIGHEPNLAYEWDDISITDHEISEYARYFSSISTAIKSLNHSNSIRIMPAGLAPTTGLKECELTPFFKKKYHDEDSSYDLGKAEESDAHYTFSKSDCELLGNDYVSGAANYCTGETLSVNNAPNCNPICNDIIVDNCDDDEQVCICPKREEFIQKVLTWYTAYQDKFSHVFSDLQEPVVSCDIAEVEKAELVKSRIQQTFQEFCFEKITEVHPDEYLKKMFESSYGNDVCQQLDIYADHSYPSSADLDEYPGGNNPFGMLAYEDRFSLVNQYCSKLSNYECIPPDDSDSDGDGFYDLVDNCPDTPNDQFDWNYWMGYSIGDACEDYDHDDVLDEADVCPNNDTIKDTSDISDPVQAEDPDNDNWPNICDNCPNTFNNNQIDKDEDGIGDKCDSQTDGDDIPNILDDPDAPKCIFIEPGHADNVMEDCIDNCPYDDNEDQLDTDEDEVGDMCDNCPSEPNPEQLDWNNDGEGDVCDDTDNDGFLDSVDLCPNTWSEENTDDVCNPDELCIGNIFITQTAWAPHPKNLISDFDVDDYVDQRQESFDNWIIDERIMGITVFQLGESEQYEDYAWTTEVCAQGCNGREIFNAVAGIEDQANICEEEIGCNNDGIPDEGEECDGDTENGLRNLTCDTYPGGAYSGGPLACNDDCMFNTTLCVPKNCNNDGIPNEGEECDGEDLRGKECIDFDYDGGDLLCNDDCTFNTSECTNGIPSCDNNEVRLNNLKRDVGKNTIEYSCYDCETGQPTKTKLEVGGGKVGEDGVNYNYVGMEDCFEEDWIELPDLCKNEAQDPDTEIDLHQGVEGMMITIDEEEYVAMVLCSAPDLASHLAYYQLCGTAEECDDDIDNCYESGDMPDYTYGYYWHRCKTPE